MLIMNCPVGGKSFVTVPRGVDAGITLGIGLLVAGKVEVSDDGWVDTVCDRAGFEKLCIGICCDWVAAMTIDIDSSSTYTGELWTCVKIER